jgi:hypothetical protein
LSGTGRIEHAVADETYVQWFMAGTPAGDQCHFASFQLCPPYVLAFWTQCNNAGVSGGKAIKAFGQNAAHVVDQLFHRVLSFFVGAFITRAI